MAMECRVIRLKTNHKQNQNPGSLDGFVEVSFRNPFPPNTVVGVVATTQSFNGIETPGLRVRDVTNRGFRIRFNEIISRGGGKSVNSNGNHTFEEVAYIAFESAAIESYEDPKPEEEG